MPKTIKSQPLILVALPPEVAAMVHRALAATEREFEAKLRRLRPPRYRRAAGAGSEASAAKPAARTSSRIPAPAA
jgi:hypothetical protein